MLLSRWIGLGLLACVVWKSALFSATPEVYVVNETDGTVSVIDVLTNTVTATITVGATPNFIALTPSGNELYVPNSGGNTINVIDVATHTVDATITVGGSPGFVAFTSTEAYTGNFNSPSTVSVINLASKMVTATITLASNAGPFYLATTPDESQVYVLNQGTSGTGNTVNVIDTTSHTIIATATVGTVPEFVAFTNSKAFITNLITGNVSVINLASPSTVAATITVGMDPVFIAVTPDQTEAYVANSGSTLIDSGSVSVINTAANAVIATISPASGNAATYLAISPDGSTVYAPISTVSGGGSGNVVQVISTATHLVTATVTVGTGALFDLVSPDGKAVYVLNSPSFVSPGSVSVIDTTSNLMTANVTVGVAPVWAVLVNFPSPTPPGPSAPTSPTGRQVGNCFFDQTDLINVIRWNASMGTPEPVQYKIYRNAALSDFAGSVPASQLEFEDHNRQENQTYTYYIVAEDGSGNTSSAATVTVTPNGDPC